MLLHPVSEAGQAITDKARSRILDALPYHLQEPLADLDRELVTRLADTEMVIIKELSEDDWRELVLFAYANRTYAEAFGPLVKLANKADVDLSSLSDSQRSIVEQKVLQNLSWEKVVASAELEGQKQALQVLRDSVGVLLDQYAPDGLDKKMALAKGHIKQIELVN